MTTNASISNKKDYSKNSDIEKRITNLVEFGKYNHQSFINHWNEFSECHINNIYSKAKEYYRGDDLWTNFLIGNKKSGNKGSPFGDFLISKIQGLEYRKEDAGIDLTFTQSRNFDQVFGLGKPDNHFTDHPTNYLIYLEHENNVHDCWREMIKLTLYKSKLKVLVTYNDKRDEVFDVLNKNFQSISEQTNLFFPENTSTEYLLIVENWNYEINQVTWKYFAYNFAGKRLNK